MPGWVSQKRSQVQEGKNSPVAAPGENMEFQERNARSIGAIQPPMVSIAYEQHLTPQDDGFMGSIILNTAIQSRTSQCIWRA